MASSRHLPTTSVDPVARNAVSTLPSGIGKITAADLKERLAPFNKDITSKDIKFLMNNQEEITFTELYHLLSDNELTDFDPIAEAFKLYDPNDTGYVDMKTVKEFFKKAGYGLLSEGDVDAILQMADADRDGKLGLGDFRKLIRIGQEAPSTEVDALTTEGDVVPTENGGLTTEGDGVLTENGGLTTEGDGVPTENGGLTTEGDGVPTENGGLTTEGDGVATGNGGLTTEGDGVATGNGGLTTEGDGVATGNGGLTTEGATVPTESHSPTTGGNIPSTEAEALT
ncbi:conserved hypothetical protein [Perkinsus marinus ATCC 50983]|uniref:EF-hand domain-containing protein n=1 Tax=Perkinsus marinus (strain ATCC 50983 / TXsc) TaxID=423536 RepID=C5KSU3_PERM5|nr:conserved hypothetical protein [Perkinsus marinus ATCC 50983]EER12293.1 conserved hypothetical protein [Perkinsus marinus ATCC 50983]|eukprot:XP_002780498.1 conserved hypothetical protein [Perkinsus marinus ATCC 50983]